MQLHLSVQHGIAVVGALHHDAQIRDAHSQRNRRAEDRDDPRTGWFTQLERAAVGQQHCRREEQGHPRKPPRQGSMPRICIG